MTGLITISWTSIGVCFDCSTGGMGSNGVLRSCKLSLNQCHGKGLLLWVLTQRLLKC